MIPSDKICKLVQGFLSGSARSALAVEGTGVESSMCSIRFLSFLFGKRLKNARLAALSTTEAAPGETLQIAGLM